MFLLRNINMPEIAVVATGNKLCCVNTQIQVGKILRGRSAGGVLYARNAQP